MGYPSMVDQIDRIFRIIRVIHRVLEVCELSPGVVLLRLSREGLIFQAGQHLLLSLPGSALAREYSIASGTDDPWLDVLIRVVKGGAFSPRLARLRPGQEVEVSGPCGFFTPNSDPGMKVLVATGTGVAPFRSFVRSGLVQGAALAHGVRFLNETHWFHDWHPCRYVRCVSRESGGDIQGRVTDWMARAVCDIPDAQWWLCGNSVMIQEGWDLLTGAGVHPERIHTEVYF